MLEHLNQTKFPWLIFSFEFGSVHSSYCWTIMLNFKSGIYADTQERLRPGVTLRLGKCPVGSCAEDFMGDIGCISQSSSL